MAYVLSSVSGNLISAASAGFAPTNSADVSAIASAYQVVSATATQLYAGTAYVTSVNDAPLSASRAGNAANASLANSAYYDGTGRLISALPDSAAVSAIASAYAESAASGKLDYSAVGIDSEMMVVSSIDDTYVSAWIAGSAEHWSGASGKQDTLTFAYNADSAISSINGSALAGQGGGSVMSPSGTIIVTDGTAIEATNSAIGTAEGFEVLGSSGTYSFSYGNVYQSLGGYNPFKARGIGITYISSTGDRTASVSANTPDGNFEATFVLPASSVSAGVIFSETPIYNVYEVMLKMSGSTVTLSGTNPALFLTTGEPYSVVKELAWKSDVPTIDIGLYSNYYGTYVSSINGYGLSASKALSSISATYALQAKTDMQGRDLSSLAAKSSVPSGVSSPSATLMTDGFEVEATNSAVSTGTVAGYPLQSVTYTAENPYASLGPDGAYTVTLPEHPKAVLALAVGWLSYASTVSAVYGYHTATAAVPTGYSTALLKVSNSTTARLYCDNYCSLNGASASADSTTAITGVGELAWASAIPTYSYDAEDKISAINGSAIAGGGGGGGTGDYVEKSATDVAIGSAVSASGSSMAQGSRNTAYNNSFAQGYLNGASSTSFAQGNYNQANLYSFAQGVENNADSDGFAQGYKNTGRNLSFAQGERNSADMYSFAQGNYSTAYGVSFAQGSGVSAKYTAAVFGKNNLSGDGSASSGAAFVIGDGTATAARHDLMVVTKDGEITMYSGTADTTGTGIMSSIRAISAAATGGGGVDSATVSAIASSYAESAASSKLDTTAFNSSDFYSTSNPSGFIDSAYVDSAVSGKADSSALSSYALSADVSGTVDLVSAQSANWGGSALALSAGPGVKLEKVGNTLVASTDETVLWSGFVKSTGSAYDLFESMANFERVKFVCSINSANHQRGSLVTEYDITLNDTTPRYFYPECRNIAANTFTSNIIYVSASDTQWSLLNGVKYVNTAITTGVGTYDFYMNKIIGINRTAEA